MADTEFKLFIPGVTFQVTRDMTRQTSTVHITFSEEEVRRLDGPLSAEDYFGAVSDGLKAQLIGAWNKASGKH